MGKHITISTQEAARLLNKPIRTVQNMISTGKLHGELVPNQYGGGIGGEAFQVYLDEIPFEARIPYYIDKGRDACLE